MSTSIYTADHLIAPTEVARILGLPLAEVNLRVREGRYPLVMGLVPRTALEFDRTHPAYPATA